MTGMVYTNRSMGFIFSVEYLINASARKYICGCGTIAYGVAGHPRVRFTCHHKESSQSASDGAGRKGCPGYHHPPSVAPSQQPVGRLQLAWLIDCRKAMGNSAGEQGIYSTVAS